MKYLNYFLTILSKGVNNLYAQVYTLIIHYTDIVYTSILLLKITKRIYRVKNKSFFRKVYNLEKSEKMRKL